MTPNEQIELVRGHYALQAAGDYPAAEELLTDDFVITIPSFLPFAGIYRGRQAFRKLIPLVVETVAVTNLEFIATTAGDDYAIQIVEFTLAGVPAPTLVAEANQFRNDQICEIRPFYSDPAPWIAAARCREAAAGPTDHQ